MYSVILPTYNEKDNLPLMIYMLDKAFRERCGCNSLTSCGGLLCDTSLGTLKDSARCALSYFLSSSLEYEVIVVEDSSPDGTYEVALQLQRLFGADVIKVLKRPGKMGLGSAYIDGLKLASGDYIFIMDADLSHHVRRRSCL